MHIAVYGSKAIMYSVLLSPWLLLGRPAVFHWTFLSWPPGAHLGSHSAQFFEEARQGVVAAAHCTGHGGVQLRAPVYL
eukprot:scaffold197496_cov15-Prasinocladus_malaysianus.AAC.1